MPGDSADNLLFSNTLNAVLYTARFTFFGCSIDVVTGYYQAQVDSAKRSILRVMCIYFRHCLSELPWASYKSSTKRQEGSRKNGHADILRTDALESALHHTIDIHRYR